MKEAESYQGTSLILCFAPCVDWGYEDIGSLSQIEIDAVNAGYWPIYRYNPMKVENKFVLDNKKTRGSLVKFLKNQNRFVKLMRENPELAKDLHSQLEKEISTKMEKLLLLSMSY